MAPGAIKAKFARFGIQNCHEMTMLQQQLKMLAVMAHFSFLNLLRNNMFSYYRDLKTGGKQGDGSSAGTIPTTITPDSSADELAIMMDIQRCP